MYKNLRNIHLLCGSFALPMLLMYALSAVQMAHNKWFPMKPEVSERVLKLEPGLGDARQVSRKLLQEQNLQGELGAVQAAPGGVEFRLAVPGTVHQVRYDAGGETRVRTSVAGTMGMLNRLHHAAGFWPEFIALRLWGGLVLLVSAATLALGVTGIWMWWLRGKDRALGLVLVLANLAFSLAILAGMRAKGGF